MRASLKAFFAACSVTAICALNWQMSSINAATAAAPWLKNKRARFFEPTGPSVASYAPPTGDPLDTFHGLYAGTPLTATLPPQSSGPPPSILEVIGSFSGTIGSTNALPTFGVTYENEATSITYTIYAGPTWPPTAPVASGSVPVANPFSVQYTGATVAGDYYKGVFTVTNASGSDTDSNSPLLNLVAPSVIITSIAFAGSVGSTSAIPSCFFTPSGTVTSITYTLYGDTSPTPTTVVSTGPLATSATFYQYLGATVNGYYYKYTITVANAAGSNTATSSVLQNINVWTPTTPVAKLAAWFDGTRGVLVLFRGQIMETFLETVQ